MSGRLEVVCGPMFSGKTEELIRRLRRSELLSPVYCFKPRIDDRYHKESIVSHSKQSFSSTVVDTSSNIREHLARVSAPVTVGIEEVQFLDDGVVDLIRELVARDFTVVVAGLDMDYMCKPFMITATLLACADKILKLHSICMGCHGKATKTYKKLLDGAGRIAVGGSEMYEPRCSSCHDLGAR